MKRALVLIAMTVAIGSSAHARPEVLRFDGEARIDLHERLVHGDPNAIWTKVVDLRIELHGVARTVENAARAIGTATIGRSDGSTSTVALEGGMSPPDGGGGRVVAVGVGDDGSVYCFSILDQADAPTPRPDQIVAAYEPGGRFAAGVAAIWSTASITDICLALEHPHMKAPHSGDFAFTTVL